MPNPWKDIDKLRAQHTADLSRARAAVTNAKATSLKVLDTGIWKCRFRPFKKEPVDVRGRNASELIEELDKLVKERTAAREAAAKTREESRRQHLEAVAKTREELRALGAKRVKVKRLGSPPHHRYLWSCWFNRRGVLEEFEFPTADALIAAVRRAAGKDTH